MKPDEYKKMFQVEDSHWWFMGKRHLLRECILKTKLSETSKIFDAGCGTGAVSFFLKQFGHVFSMDYSDQALDFCRQRSLDNLCRGSVSQMPFQKESFDLLVSCDLLYHQWIEDDQLVLMEFNRILKPGGKLIITDSAFSFLSGKHDATVLARERYRLKQMVKKVEQVDFRIIKKSYAHFFSFPFVLIIRLLEKILPEYKSSKVDKPFLLVNILFGNLVRLEAKLHKYISFPCGSSILILAEKKSQKGDL